MADEAPPVEPVPSSEISADPSLAATGAVGSTIGFDGAELQQVLTDMYADSALTGAHVAAFAAGQAAESFLPFENGIDWSNWQPGDLRAAQYVAGSGLRELLNNLSLTIQGLNDTSIDKLGDIVANGLNEGLGPQEIASQMVETISDPARSLMIARTESSRGQSLAEINTMRERGEDQVAWHANTGACPICLDLEADGPYDIDDAPVQPAHPNCRCRYLPVLAVNLDDL